MPTLAKGTCTKCAIDEHTNCVAPQACTCAKHEHYGRSMFIWEEPRRYGRKPALPIPERMIQECKKNPGRWAKYNTQFKDRGKLTRAAKGINQRKVLGEGWQARTGGGWLYVRYVGEGSGD